MSTKNTVLFVRQFEGLAYYLRAVGVGFVFQLFKLIVRENFQPAED